MRIALRQNDRRRQNTTQRGPGAVANGQTSALLRAKLGCRLSICFANGANPIAVVIPCHRVIAADGSLHGYGGGLDCKRWLLEHEGALTRRLPGM